MIPDKGNGMKKESGFLVPLWSVDSRWSQTEKTEPTSYYRCSSFKDISSTFSINFNESAIKRTSWRDDNDKIRSFKSSADQTFFVTSHRYTDLTSAQIATHKWVSKHDFNAFKSESGSDTSRPETVSTLATPSTFDAQTARYNKNLQRVSSKEFTVLRCKQSSFGAGGSSEKPVVRTCPKRVIANRNPLSTTNAPIKSKSEEAQASKKLNGTSTENKDSKQRTIITYLPNKPVVNYVQRNAQRVAENAARIKAKEKDKANKDPGWNQKKTTTTLNSLHASDAQEKRPISKPIDYLLENAVDRNAKKSKIIYPEEKAPEPIKPKPYGTMPFTNRRVRELQIEAAGMFKTNRSVLKESLNKESLLKEQVFPQSSHPLAAACYDFRPESVKQALIAKTNYYTTAAHGKDDTPITLKAGHYNSDMVTPRHVISDSAVTTMKARTGVSDIPISTVNARQGRSDSAITTVKARTGISDSPMPTVNARQGRSDSAITTVKARTGVSDSPMPTVEARQDRSESTITYVKAKQERSEDKNKNVKGSVSSESILTPVKAKQNGSGNTEAIIESIKPGRQRSTTKKVLVREPDIPVRHTKKSAQQCELKHAPDTALPKVEKKLCYSDRKVSKKVVLIPHTAHSKSQGDERPKSVLSTSDKSSDATASIKSGRAKTAPNARSDREKAANSAKSDRAKTPQHARACREKVSPRKTPSPSPKKTKSAENARKSPSTPHRSSGEVRKKIRHVYESDLKARECKSLSPSSMEEKSTQATDVRTQPIIEPLFPEVMFLPVNKDKEGCVFFNSLNQIDYGLSNKGKSDTPPEKLPNKYEENPDKPPEKLSKKYEDKGKPDKSPEKLSKKYEEKDKPDKSPEKLSKKYEEKDKPDKSPEKLSKKYEEKDKPDKSPEKLPKTYEDKGKPDKPPKERYTKPYNPPELPLKYEDLRLGKLYRPPKERCKKYNPPELPKKYEDLQLDKTDKPDKPQKERYKKYNPPEPPKKYEDLQLDKTDKPDKPQKERCKKYNPPEPPKKYEDLQLGKPDKPPKERYKKYNQPELPKKYEDLQLGKPDKPDKPQKERYKKYNQPELPKKYEDLQVGKPDKPPKERYKKYNPPELPKKYEDLQVGKPDKPDKPPQERYKKYNPPELPKKYEDLQLGKPDKPDKPPKERYKKYNQPELPKKYEDLQLGKPDKPPRELAKKYGDSATGKQTVVTRTDEVTSNRTSRIIRSTSSSNTPKDTNHGYTIRDTTQEVADRKLVPHPPSQPTSSQRTRFHKKHRYIEVSDNTEETSPHEARMVKSADSIRSTSTESSLMEMPSQTLSGLKPRRVSSGLSNQKCVTDGESMSPRSTSTESPPPSFTSSNDTPTPDLQSPTNMSVFGYTTNNLVGGAEDQETIHPPCDDDSDSKVSIVTSISALSITRHNRSSCSLTDSSSSSTKKRHTKTSPSSC